MMPAWPRHRLLLFQSRLAAIACIPQRPVGGNEPLFPYRPHCWPLSPRLTTSCRSCHCTLLPNRAPRRRPALHTADRHRETCFPDWARRCEPRSRRRAGVMMRWLIDSPRPVPLPVRLRVKNGSKMFSSTSAGHAAAGVLEDASRPCRRAMPTVIVKRARLRPCSPGR